MKKWLKYKFFIIGGLVLVFFLMATFLYLYSAYLNSIYVSVNSTDNSPKLVIVKNGMKADQLGKVLYNDNLVASPFWLKVYLRGHHLDNKLQAGRYKFYSWMPPVEIIRKIINGEVIKDEIKITIPEGFTNRQIDQKLKEKFNRSLDLADFRVADFQGKYKFLAGVSPNKSLQGFLFPDTYLCPRNIQSQEIVMKMLSNFANQIQKLKRIESASSSLSLYQKIILASIVEKEVRSLKDKRIVAGIFINRLKNGQPLESCATVAYALGKNKKIYSADDIKVNSPFNTYLHPGLPPEPICNPGLGSLLAVSNPIKTDYNYFLTDPKTGQTIFSRTLLEQQRNKRKYLK